MNKIHFKQEELPEGARNYAILPKDQIVVAMEDLLAVDPQHGHLVVPLSELKNPETWKKEIKGWQSLGFAKPYFDGFMGFSPQELPFRYKVALYIEEQVASGASETYNLAVAYEKLKNRGYTPEFNLTFYHASRNQNFAPDPLLKARYKFYPMLHNLFTDLVDLAAIWRTGALLYIDHDVDPFLDVSKISVSDFPEPKPFQVRELLSHTSSGIFVGYRIDS